MRPRHLDDLLVPRELRPDGVRAGLDALDPVDETTSGRPPVFVLAAGWRTGSTLLQRLFVGGGDGIVWGEPYGRGIPVPRLAEIAAFAGRDHVRIERREIDTAQAEDAPLAEQFIANLSPGLAPVRDAERHFFDDLLAGPAAERGFEAWGAKFVRVHAEYAHHLRWLYPDARFVLLVRHPLEALSSYLGKPNRWKSVHSSGPVGTWRFLAHWTMLARSFLDEADRLPAVVVRFEDLTDPDRSADVIAEIETLTGWRLDRAHVERRVGGTRSRAVVTAQAYVAYHLLCRRVATRYDYEPPSISQIRPDRQNARRRLRLARDGIVDRLRRGR